MSNLPYYEDIADLDGNLLTGIAFGGLGQSPGIAALVSVPAMTALNPAFVTVAEVGFGYYAVGFDAAEHGEAFIVLDIGVDYQGRTRYRGIPLTAAPAASSAGPTVQQIAAGILANPDHLLVTDANGNVAASNVPAELAAADVVTALHADAEWRKILAYVAGGFHFDPATGVEQVFDAENGTLATTFTLSRDASGNTTNRVAS